MSDCRILHGDALAMLRTLPDKIVHSCVTSPPYLGLRNYGVAGQIGLEPTPAEYVARLVDVFAEVWRVLRDDGTLWLNLGDSYANDAKWGGATGGKHVDVLHGNSGIGRQRTTTGMKPKDLMGIPWRVAFALQDAGWTLRSDIIWHKPNPMPESVTDRPTKAHEYLFLLSKSPRYYYDAQAIAEPVAEYPAFKKSGEKINTANYHGDTRPNGYHATAGEISGTRNRRSVWTVATEPTPYAHFATMPTALVEPCILAGTSAHGCCPACGAPLVRVVEKVAYTPAVVADDVRHVDASRGDKTRKLNGKSAEFRESSASTATVGWVPSCTCAAEPPVPCTVLDPFAGSGTTLRVARRLGRNAIGIELNPAYVELANRLLAETQPAMFGVGG